MKATMNAAVAQLIDELRHTSANAVMFNQAVASKAGIHPTDNKCLDLLLLYGPLTAGMVSTMTGLTTGSVTSAIDRLERRGYVIRRGTVNDRRSVTIHPDIAKISQDIGIYSNKLADRVSAMAKQYDERDLMAIAAFLAAANALVADEIKQLR